MYDPDSTSCRLPREGEMTLEFLLRAHNRKHILIHRKTPGLSATPLALERRSRKAIWRRYFAETGETPSWPGWQYTPALFWQLNQNGVVWTIMVPFKRARWPPS